MNDQTEFEQKADYWGKMPQDAAASEDKAGAVELERDILKGKVEALETELADVMDRWKTSHAALVQVRQENRVLVALAGKLAGAGGADEG